jgi:hypothetical protein
MLVSEVLGQQSQIKIRNQEEITQFVEEKMKMQLTDQVDETIGEGLRRSS